MEYFILNAIIHKSDKTNISDKEKLAFIEKLITLIETEGFESICYSKLASKKEAAKLIQKLEG